jgi:uncharacterized Zn ribbon protein
MRRQESDCRGKRWQELERQVDCNTDGIDSLNLRVTFLGGSAIAGYDDR